MSKEKVCLECGEPLKGRADKKFCDDQCRSNYNNKMNSDVTAEMRNINNILRKNRRILESIVQGSSSKKISKQKLIDSGFNFKYFTQMHTTKAEDVYKLCYDFAYAPFENDYYMVINWNTFLKKEN